MFPGMYTRFFTARDCVQIYNHNKAVVSFNCYMYLSLFIFLAHKIWSSSTVSVAPAFIHVLWPINNVDLLFTKPIASFSSLYDEAPMRPTKQWAGRHFGDK